MVKKSGDTTVNETHLRFGQALALACALGAGWESPEAGTLSTLQC